ncbi:MAG: metal-dependent transcriptional regulator [Terriglobia bacterium]
MWRAVEEANQPELDTEKLPEFVENRATFLLMAQDGLISLDGRRMSFTGIGQERADQLIRRHRLAERLFFETFGMGEEALHENACKVEPLWTPAVTNQVCTFLNHPQTCPHGDPIPRGACCPTTK